MKINYKDPTVTIANEIVNMFYNNFVEECGGEPFEGWCEDGDIFEDYKEYGADEKELISLMKEVAPHVDAITGILNKKIQETL